MRIFKIEEKYYCVLDSKFSYENFKKEIASKLNMREGSFAYFYSLKIIGDLFEYAKDMKQEYVDYYIEEYNDFEEYLYRKKLMEKKDIQYLSINEDQTVLEIRMNLSNYNASSLIEYGDENLKVLNTILEEVGR